ALPISEIAAIEHAASDSTLQTRRPAEFPGGGFISNWLETQLSQAHECEQHQSGGERAVLRGGSLELLVCFDRRNGAAHLHAVIAGRAGVVENRNYCFRRNGPQHCFLVFGHSSQIRPQIHPLLVAFAETACKRASLDTGATEPATSLMFLPIRLKHRNHHSVIHL